MGESTDKKGNLIDVLMEVQTAAKDIISEGQTITKQAQHAYDAATHLKDTIVQFPDDSLILPWQWKDMTEEWRSTAQSMRSANNALSGMYDMLSTVTSSNASTVITRTTILSIPPPYQSMALAAYKLYQQDLSAHDFVAEIEIECASLGIHHSGTAMEPVASLIRHGKEAFDAPASGSVSPAAVLLPLRTAIERACADLLRKLPEQEKVKGYYRKITLICNQCGRSNVQQQRVERLAQQAPVLHDKLSEAKGAIMTRDQVQELMNEAFLFLLDFLLAVDESKLRT